MPVIAIPKDIEFRKVTPTQQKSLEKIVGDNQNRILQAVAIPTVALTALTIVGGAAYLFKDIIAKFAEDNIDNFGEAFVEKIKDTATGAGGIVADVITTVVGRDEPQTPEFTPSGAGPIPRCKRWESDYVNTQALAQGDLSRTETIALASAQLNIIKNMKAEKCPKPSTIPQHQWDEV